ncbi:MAG: hypothetical protein HY897_14390, partial [Deltaproteobacteria bacterium]|nr:hypothetical protein [Deltaproteobacteria bacterium]
MDFPVPTEAQIGCKAAADCPSGWACNEKIGRCVKTEAMDTTAPGLAGEVAVSPAVLKKGATATVSFEATEELLSPPEVSINIGGNARLLSMDEKAAGTKYAFTYKAGGDEPQGVDSPITIKLTDKSGNVAGNISGKSLAFDFIAPSIDKVSVEGSPAKKGGKVLVRFSAGEKLEQDPVLTLDDGTALEKDASSKNLDYVYSYTASGGESEDSEGIGVSVNIRDEAGNAVAVTLEQNIVFDFTAPALSGAPVVTPLAAKNGEPVAVTVKTTEPVKVPVVTLDGVAMELSGAAEGLQQAFKFTHVAEKDKDAEGEKAIEIALEDAAGNTAAGLAGGTVLFDFAPPSLTNMAGLEKKYSAAAGFSTVTLTFDSSEDVGAGLSVAIGGALMTCDAWQPASPNYKCTYTVTGDEGEGVKEVSVTTKDAAGNTGFASRTVEYDLTGPVLTLAVQPPDRPARLGELVTVGVASSEALDQSGIQMNAGGLSLGAPSGS